MDAICHEKATEDKLMSEKDKKKTQGPSTQLNYSTCILLSSF